MNEKKSPSEQVIIGTEKMRIAFESSKNQKSLYLFLKTQTKLVQYLVDGYDNPDWL